MGGHRVNLYAMCSDETWGENESHCSACGSTFASLADFDEHRTGLMSTRRCLDPKAAGLRPELTDRGVVWTSHHPEGAR